jgi:hypothetical protein
VKQARSARAGVSWYALSVVVVALTSTLPAAAAPAEAAPASEGRQLVAAYNTDFQWGLSPGVAFSKGQTSFLVGARVGYGFDTGTVLLVPGVRLAATFADPGVYLGAPALKLVFPIDSFAPFVEGGAGVGYVGSKGSTSAQAGLALLAGAGFMQHFNWKFGLGVEASYQVIPGTGWSAFGLGPILALAF